MSVEYPTYGIYDDKRVSLEQDQFLNDSITVFDFIVNELKIDPQQVMIVGRSIGSGPAHLLASKRPAGAFILFSPLLSVKDVAKSLPGVGWIAGMVVSSTMFNNGEKIKEIKTPTFIVHGKRDEVVPHSHGEKLFLRSPVAEHLKRFHSVPHMTHNNFSLFDDFVDPCLEFLTSLGLIGGKHAALRPINVQPLIDQYHRKQIVHEMIEENKASSSFTCF